jgi:hypothetical protein
MPARTRPRPADPGRPVALGAARRGRLIRRRRGDRYGGLTGPGPGRLGARLTQPLDPLANTLAELAGAITDFADALRYHLMTGDLASRGGVYQAPGVRVLNEEARSYLSAGAGETFDLIVGVARFLDGNALEFERNSRRVDDRDGKFPLLAGAADFRI